MHSLKNDEFPQLYGNVCSVLEGEEITLLHVKESFERVKTHLEPLKFVKNFNGSHPLSEVLMINAKLRKDHLLSLQMGIKAKLLSEKTEEREAAKELIKWLGKYRGILYYPGIESQSRLVNNLLHDKELSDKVQNALSVLALDELFAFVVAETVEMETGFRMRNNEIADMRKHVRSIRNAAYADLKILLSMIENTTKMDDGNITGYSAYSARIKNFLDYYRGRLTARKSARRVTEKDLVDNSGNIPEDEETAV